MRRSFRKSLTLLSGACLLSAIVAEPAHAAGSGMLVGAEMAALIQILVQSPNLCIAYTYDANGNRTGQVNSVYGSGATWGSVAYGCFTWTAP